MNRSNIAAAVLLMASAAASAQQPSTPPAQAQRAPAPTSQRVTTDIGPSNVVQAAAAIAQLIDGGRIAEVWDGSSPISQKQTDRKKFVDTITAQRKPLGAPTARHWVAVTRNVVQNNPSVPNGLYVSARFETHFANNRVASELFSFRFDDDKTWRLSGYSIN